jgi:uncharacterized protein
MSDWSVGAARDLPISDSSSWDAAAARAAVFSWAGFDGDTPDPDKARRAFLLHDTGAPALRGSYKLPIATVVGGRLTVVSEGLREAARALAHTEIPEPVADRARALLDGQFRRVRGKADDQGAGVERKFAPLYQTELKADAGDKRQIEGYASTFGGDPDSYGDVIVKGAFAESLRARKPKLLWQHDQAQPIGKATRLEEDSKGLYGRWQLAGTSQALDAYELVKEGLVEGLSIGFIPKEWDYRADDGVRILHTVDLLEISAVTIPANENALITGVKADIPFDQFIARICSGLTLATDEAEALVARRGAEGRLVTDRHRAAIAQLLGKAEAELDRLRRLVGDEEARALVPKEVRFRLMQATLRLKARGIID